MSKYFIAVIAAALAMGTPSMPNAQRSPRVQQSDINIQTSFGWSLEEQERSGFKIRNELSPWPLKLPLDWAADPYQDTNWKFNLHSWRMTDPILEAYFATGDTSLIKEAFKYANDWRRFHYLDKRTAEFSWYDMAAGIRALRIAFFIDRIESGELKVDLDEVDGLYEMADDHARRLQDENYIKPNNHGIFQVFGLNLLCMAAETRPACANGHEFARKKFEEIFDGQFTREGIHREQSPAYHWFAEKSIRLLMSSNGIILPQVYATLAKAREALPWLTFPEGSLARVGDTEGPGYSTSVIPSGGGQCLNGASCYGVGDFSHSGYVVVRSMPEVPMEQQSMLFVTGMMHNYTHKHADDLSFELFESGRFVLIDSGKYGYINDRMRDYVLSAAAHNTIGLENKEVGPRTTRPYGSALNPVVKRDNYFEISGAIQRPGLFDQLRQMFYRPGEFLVIRDQLKPRRSRENFVSSLLFAPDLEVKLIERTAVADLGNGRSVRAELMDNDCSLQAARGQQNPILGWTTIRYLEMTPATVLQAICPNSRRTVTWAISFNEEGKHKAAELSLRDNRVHRGQ